LAGSRFSENDLSIPVLEELRGDVEITGTDTDAVKVGGQLIVRSMDRETADRTSSESPLEVSGDANRVVIRLGGESRRRVNVSHSLDISVPKGASVEVEGRSGDLRISHVTGSVDVKGRGSDVDLSDIGGPVTISGAYNGALQLQQISKPVEFHGTRTELHVERIPGELRIALGDVRATNLVGPLRLSTRSHDVRIDGVSNAVDITSERGDLDLRPGSVPLSHIQAHARSGDIRLSLPPAAQFTLNARTSNGEITNEFGGALKHESSGRSSTLQGAVGNGPEINLETERGEILVRKAGDNESTPGKTLPSKQAPLEKLDQ